MIPSLTTRGWLLRHYDPVQSNASRPAGWPEELTDTAARGEVHPGISLDDGVNALTQIGLIKAA